MKFPTGVLLTLLTLHAAAAAAAAAEESAFMAAVHESSNTTYKSARESAEKLVAEGRLDEANAAYLSAVLEDKMTPADCFVLGSVFFGMNPELSARFHERAFKALPEDPHVNLEWAMTLHRQGHHAKAAACYRTALKAIEMQGHYLPQVLLADCLVRTGELKEAVTHWERADHPSNHTAIDFAIHAIYGKTSPHARHDKLLKAVKAGEVDRLDELIDQAASWDTDWWNVKVNRPFLERDLALAQTLLGAEDARFKELQLCAATYSKDPVDKAWLQAELESRNLIIGPAGVLPKSAYVTDRLLALVMEHKLMAAPELLKLFEAELDQRARIKGTRGAMALNTLAVLILGSEDPGGARLAKVDELGWETHHEERFAASSLVGKVGRDELRLSSPLLQRARSEFPESQPIGILALSLAVQEQAPQRDYLISAIKAEFRHLSTSLGPHKDSYRLKALFALLAKDLEA